MKKFIVAIAALGTLGLGLTSCSKDEIIDDLISITISKAAEAEFTIPVIPVGGIDTTLGESMTYFNLDSLIREETDGELDLSSIESVTIDKLTLALDESGANAADQDNNLSNFEEVKIVFSSDANSTPLVFSVNIPDEYTTSIDFTVDQTASIKNYMEGNNFGYTVSGKIRKATTHELDGNVIMKFKVKE